MEKALELFSIFGGVDWGDVDTKAELFDLIEKLILNDYTYIRNDISDLTTGMPLYHSVLSGIALGDGRTHSAFKRANVNSEVGIKAINELCEMGVINKELSKKEFTSWAENYQVSDKLIFTTPFMRFWFAFVSPLFKGIKEGNYKEIKDRFNNKKAELFASTFAQLSLGLLDSTFKDDPIVQRGSYWDKGVELDIYAKTKSGKIIVGDCSYANSKMKKNALTKLQEKCENAKIKPDMMILVSKKGFSNELKSLKNENLKLLSLKHFKNLVNETTT